MLLLLSSAYQLVSLVHRPTSAEVSGPEPRAQFSSELWGRNLLVTAVAL